MQPSSAPAPKVQAVGVSGLLLTVVALVLASVGIIDPTGLIATVVASVLLAAAGYLKRDTRVVALLARIDGKVALVLQDAHISVSEVHELAHALLNVVHANPAVEAAVDAGLNDAMQAESGSAVLAQPAAAPAEAPAAPVAHAFIMPEAPFTGTC